MATKIKYREYDKISYITLHEENEKYPPTLDFEVLDELNKAINKVFENISNLRALVIQSDSTKYFCAGANIKILEKLTPEKFSDWIKIGHITFNRFQALPIPTIAKVIGYALGGGLELAMACDIILATDDSFFGQPEASLGVMPGWGGSYRLTGRVGLTKAKEMFFTAKIISAKEAHQIGLINHLLPRDGINEYLKQFLLDIKKNSKLSLSYIKEIVNRQSIADMENNRIDEANAAVLCLYSPVTKKCIQKFLNSKKSKNQ